MAEATMLLAAQARVELDERSPRMEVAHRIVWEWPSELRLQGQRVGVAAMAASVAFLGQLATPAKQQQVAFLPLRWRHSLDSGSAVCHRLLLLLPPVPAAALVASSRSVDVAQ